MINLPQIWFHDQNRSLIEIWGKFSWLSDNFVENYMDKNISSNSNERDTFSFVILVLKEMIDECIFAVLRNVSIFLNNNE